ncbi:hypothetical protein WAI453_003105 [Rhynchosporium graminicola]
MYLPRTGRKEIPFLAFRPSCTVPEMGLEGGLLLRSRATLKRVNQDTYLPLRQGKSVENIPSPSDLFSELNLLGTRTLSQRTI